DADASHERERPLLAQPAGDEAGTAGDRGRREEPEHAGDDLVDRRFVEISHVPSCGQAGRGPLARDRAPAPRRRPFPLGEWSGPRQKSGIASRRHGIVVGQYSPRRPPMGELHFNPIDPEFVADPYPMYRRLRAEDPVHHSPLGFWILTRYEDVVAALRDPRLAKEAIASFVAARFGAPVPAMGLSMLDRDPPDHTRLRGLVSKAFTPRVV